MSGGRGPTYRYWTRREMDALEEAWKVGGMKAAREALPHRSEASLRGKVDALNLNLPGRKRYERIPDSEMEWVDAALRRAYRDGRPDLVQLSLQLNRPKGALKSRACLLGLARPAARNGLEWTDDESRLLAECLNAGLAIRTVHKRFLRAGFKRSLTAIACRVSRSNLSWQRNFLVSTEVAVMFDVDPKIVHGWLRAGLLKAKRAPGPSSIRDVSDRDKLWQIQVEDVREFMLTHPERWEHRKMQQQILLDLLCGSDFNRHARQESA